MKKLVIFLFAVSMLRFNGYSQTDTSFVVRNQSGKISFLRFGYNTRNFPSIAQSKNILTQYLNPLKEIEFRLAKSDLDNLGFINDNYDVFYKGIRIVGMKYGVNSKAGNITTMGGNYDDIPEMDVTVNISKEQGLQNALAAVNAKTYAWQNQAAEKQLKAMMNNDSATFYPSCELVIAEKNNNSKSVFYLCYLYEITALDPFSSENVIVDAKSGAVLDRISKLHHVNDVQGTAQTRYSGTQTIWTNPYGTPGFILRENNVSGRNISTTNCNHTDFIGTEFQDNDNNWTAAEWNNANKDNIALDVHWASEKCFDYFKTTFNRMGYNGQYNGGIGNGVHYKTNYADAVYVRYGSSQPSGFVLCGDGDATHGPFGSLDIYAHEYGHGFWDFTVGYPANYIYSKEMGAMDEAFADIWGSIIEGSMAPTKQKWISGEEIIAGGMRNLANPKAFNMPNTYHGQYWVNTECGTPSGTNDYCGVHTNMSVPCYAFYLLCDGGTGTNDLGNAYSVTGIGMAKAAQIFYRTELVYEPYLPNIDVAFSGTRNAMVQAAIDLYGANSCEVYAVMNAWYGVGVGTAYSNSSIAGSNSFCTTSTNYTIANLPVGATVLWQVTPQNIAQVNSPNATQTTLTRLTDGTVILTAKVSTCGGNVTLTKPNLIVGNPFPQGVTTAISNYNNYSGSLLTSFSYFLPVGQWGNTTFNITDAQFSSFTWTPISIPSGATWSSTGPRNQQLNLNIQAVGAPNNSNTATVRLNATGPCGAYTNIFSATAVVRSGFGFSITPNPAQDNMTITVDDANAKSSSSSLIYGIKVMDPVLNLRSSYEYKAGMKSVMINLMNLSNGSYFISVFDGQQWSTKQLIIQR